MATYFSINDGYFNDASPTAFAAALTGGVIAGTGANLLTTTYSYPTTLATSNGSTYCGVAFQLSAVSGAPTGTIDLILSGTNGQSRTNSYPVSGLTLYTSTGNIQPGHPQGWQYFALSGDNVTYPAGTTFRVGVKTSVANKVSLIGSALTNLNREYITTTLANPANSDTVHIVGTLRSTQLDPIVIDYNVNGLTLTSLYVHNGGTLNFDHASTLSLTITSTTIGMQITPNGTVNIGTINNPVESNKTHTINLVNGSFINVHNGATFNVYGAYKTPYALLSNDASVGDDNYQVSTDISNWIGDNVSNSGGDVLAITPNTTTFTTFDTTTAKVVNANSVTTWSTATFSHNSSNYIPSIVNMTRNVRFVGSGASFGHIRFLDGSISNLNNTQFTAFSNTTYDGLQFGTNSSGSVSLSNCAFFGSRASGVPAFTLITTKAPVTNISIKECSFYNYGASTNIVSLASISANNFVFTNNIVLGASQNGMSINALSSTYANIKNNFLIGNTQNGLSVTNPYLVSGSIGGIGCMNGNCGVVVAGTNNRANYDGLAGYYNTKEGVNILGTIPQLSSTIFSNITANNNTTDGIAISANSNNLNSPIILNINGAISNNNRAVGFEAYSISGNLSSIYLANNQSSNILISIGNKETTFNNITSVNTLSAYQRDFTNKLTSTLTTQSGPFVNPSVDGSLYSDASTANKHLAITDRELSFSGDFTIECFFKTNVTSMDGGYQRRIFSFGEPDVANRLTVLVKSTGTASLAIFTSSEIITGTKDIADNEWHHMALCRVNGVLRLFVDGVLDGSVDTTQNFDLGSTTPLYLFSVNGGTIGRFNGSISNFRVLSNTGLYITDFTVPTEPFNTIPNTTLLLNGSDYTEKTYKKLPYSNVDILSGVNYGSTIFINSMLLGNRLYALKLNNTNFEQFSMESCTLSSNYEDVGSSSSVNFLQGSYQFNNCTFGTGILSSTLENYQPEVFTENGFVVMKKNGVANAHSKMLRAGTISLDESLTHDGNTISEKLEPASTITKLRSGSKMVPVNKGKSYEIRCYIRKSSDYSGDAPRLILKRNTALGYEDEILDTSSEANGTWELLIGNVPAALDAGIFEVYVDCSGERGCGSVNIISWFLT